MNVNGFTPQEIEAYERIRDAQRTVVAANAKKAGLCAGKAIYVASGAIGLLSVVEPQLATTVHTFLGIICGQIGM